MKKVGILYGQERSFPNSFLEYGRAQAPADIQFEAVQLSAAVQGEAIDCDVLIDRISQDVPFYRAALKHAALRGCAVINNPFWWSAEDKLMANVLAADAGVPVPKTVLLPSKDLPDDTTAASFTNLRYPLPWREIFDHVGFPAFMKPNTGGGWKSVYKVHDPDELFDAYGQTGQLNMLLQESIDFERYFRCYGIGGKYVRVMEYNPRNAFHERYVRNPPPLDEEVHKTLEDYVLRLCRVLGYDFNTVELAIRDGVPYAIDFTNPAPDADYHSVGKDNFDWVVGTSVEYAIERAKSHREGGDNLTWGTYVKRACGALATAAPKRKRKALAKETTGEEASAETASGEAKSD